jgi:ribosomal protein S18 acetylase RimI-like enzyme
MSPTIPAMIRRATISDIPGAHACLDAVAEERRYLAALQAPSLDESTHFWTDLIQKTEPFEIAIRGAEVVGWCDIARHRHSTLSHSGSLGMGVLAQHRRMGIGRRLLTAAIADARQASLERIELNVLASNQAARALYQSQGFLVEGVRRRYRKIDGSYEDGILMALLL